MSRKESVVATIIASDYERGLWERVFQSIRIAWSWDGIWWVHNLPIRVVWNNCKCLAWTEQLFTYCPCLLCNHLPGIPLTVHVVIFIFIACLGLCCPLEEFKTGYNRTIYIVQGFLVLAFGNAFCKMQLFKLSTRDMDSCIFSIEAYRFWYRPMGVFGNRLILSTWDPLDLHKNNSTQTLQWRLGTFLSLSFGIFWIGPIYTSQGFSFDWTPLYASLSLECR